MLNGIHAGFDRIVHSVKRHGMRSDSVPLAMGLIHDGSQLFHREGRNVIEHAIGSHPVAPVRIDFDPVRSVHDLLTYCLARFFRSVYHLDSVRQWHIRRVTQQRISAGHIQRASRNLHARPGNHAAIDRVAEVHIGIARAFGFDIANGSEAIFQSTPRVHSRQDRAILRRLLQQLDIVVRRRDVALQEHVRMRVDQPRKAGLARQIDDLASCSRGSYRFDLLALNRDDDVLSRLI